MLNLFSFFKQQAAHWRQDCTGRSADYLAGGLAALREACDTLTMQKDVVDMELLSHQLNEAHRESRELRTLNKAFDEARRSFQSKHDLLKKENEKLRAQLASKASRALAPKPIPTNLGGELGSLRQRIKELEEGGAISQQSLQNQVVALRQQLDKQTGTVRVGAHVASLPRLVRSLRRILRHASGDTERALEQVGWALDNTEAVLNGQEPPERHREPLAA